MGNLIVCVPLEEAPIIIDRVRRLFGVEMAQDLIEGVCSICGRAIAVSPESVQARDRVGGDYSCPPCAAPSNGTDAICMETFDALRDVCFTPSQIADAFDRLREDRLRDR